MLNRGKSVSRRKINLAVIIQQLEGLKTRKSVDEDALLESLISEIRGLNDQLVSIIKNSADLLNPDKKLSYEAIASQYKSPIDRLAAQLATLSKRMINGSDFQVMLAESILAGIQDAGRDLHSFAQAALQPYLDELKAIDMTRQKLIRYCKRFEDKYSLEEQSLYASANVDVQVCRISGMIEDEMPYELAKRKLIELELYQASILSAVAKDTAQSIREEQFTELLTVSDVGPYLVDKINARYAKNMRQHQDLMETLAAISLSPCIAKLNALNVNNDQWSNAEFVSAVQGVLSLQKQIKRAFYSVAPRKSMIADFQRRLENIERDVNNFGKAERDKAHKPFWRRKDRSEVLPLVRRAAEVQSPVLNDASADVTESYFQDHQSEQADGNKEGIVIRERKEVIDPDAEDEEIEADSESDLVSVKDDSKVSPEQIFDEIQSNADLLAYEADLIQVDCAVRSLSHYQAILTKKYQELKGRTDKQHGAELCSLVLTLAVIKQHLAVLNSFKENRNAEAVSLANAINDCRGSEYNFGNYYFEETHSRYQSQITNEKKRTEDYLGLGAEVARVETALRALNEVHDLKDNAVYLQSMQSIQKLSEDIWLDLHRMLPDIQKDGLFGDDGVLSDEEKSQRFKNKIASVEKDISRIKPSIEKQKADANLVNVIAGDHEGVPVARPVSPLLVKDEAPVLSQKALAHQQQFLDELTTLRDNIDKTQYCYNWQLRRGVAKATEELKRKKQKLDLINSLIEKVKNNKTISLDNMIGSFLKGEYKREGALEEKIKNSVILFQHRRTSGLLSIFNGAYKTDTQKLFDKYYPASAQSKKKKAAAYN